MGSAASTDSLKQHANDTGGTATVAADQVPSMEITKKIDTLFKMCDKNKSGTITLGEMKRYYKSIIGDRDADSYRKKAKILLQIFDIEGGTESEVGDKEITESEFAKVMTRWWQNDPKATISAIDENIELFEKHHAAKQIQKIARGKTARKAKKNTTTSSQKNEKSSEKADDTKGTPSETNESAAKADKASENTGAKKDSTQENTNDKASNETEKAAEEASDKAEKKE